MKQQTELETLRKENAALLAQIAGLKRDIEMYDDYELAIIRVAERARLAKAVGAEFDPGQILDLIKHSIDDKVTQRAWILVEVSAEDTTLRIGAAPRAKADGNKIDVKKYPAAATVGKIMNLVAEQIGVDNEGNEGDN